MSIAENLNSIKESLHPDVTLVAVSKTKPNELIQEAYDAGQRIFGENRALEMRDKHNLLPKDIEWHMIGRIQKNKVKYIAPFVSLIHSVDSISLLQEINKRAEQNERIIDCLLQIRIAKEETKSGILPEDSFEFLRSEELEKLKNVRIVGLMGMATFIQDETIIKNEFQKVSDVFDLVNKSNFKNLNAFQIKSMGMSGDYTIAMQCGSNMVRIGSTIFGARN